MLLVFSSAVFSLQSQNRERQGPGPGNQQLRKGLPSRVKLIPDIFYREGHERWKLDLYLPADRGEVPRPALVVVHGGGWRNGDKRKEVFSTTAGNYAATGWVCISVNYRLVQHAPFPACIEDVKNAVRWLRANAEKFNVDPDRIGAYGNSAGAHLVAMLGVTSREDGLEGDGPYQEYSSAVNAVCASAPPTDFINWPGRRFTSGNSRILSGTPEEIMALARKCSPITYVSKDMAPFLIIHGTRDTTVPYQQGRSFVEAAKKTGAKSVNLMNFEGAGHGVFTQNVKKTRPAMARFFSTHLGMGVKKD